MVVYPAWFSSQSSGESPFSRNSFTFHRNFFSNHQIYSKINRKMSLHDKNIEKIAEIVTNDDINVPSTKQQEPPTRNPAKFVYLDPNHDGDARTNKGYCSICGPERPDEPEESHRKSRIFKNRQSFNQHNRKYHGGAGRGPREGKLICPAEGGCRQECSSYKTLMEHLRVAHRIECYQESRRFKNMKKWNAWIQQLEFDSKCSFVGDGGTHHDKDYTRRYKKCSRSGFYERTAPDTAKARAIGSRKMQAHCPAFIRLKIDRHKGFVDADMCLTHVGHAFDIAYLDLPALLIADIQALIKAGDSTPTIIEKIKKQCTKQDRGFYLTKNQVEYYRKKLDAEKEAVIEEHVDAAVANESTLAAASIVESEFDDVVVDVLNRTDEQLNPDSAALHQEHDSPDVAALIDEDAANEMVEEEECSETWKEVIEEGSKLIDSIQSAIMLARIRYLKNTDSADDMLAFFKSMHKQLTVTKNRCNAREHPVQQLPQQPDYIRKLRKKEMKNIQRMSEANNTPPSTAPAGRKRRKTASSRIPAKRRLTNRQFKGEQQELLNATATSTVQHSGVHVPFEQNLTDEQIAQPFTSGYPEPVQPKRKLLLHLPSTSSKQQPAIPQLPSTDSGSKPRCLKAVYVYRSREQYLQPQPLTEMYSPVLQRTAPQLLLKSPNKPSPMLSSTSRFVLSPNERMAMSTRTGLRPTRPFLHRMELRNPGYQ